MRLSSQSSFVLKMSKGYKFMVIKHQLPVYPSDVDENEDLIIE